MKSRLGMAPRLRDLVATGLAVLLVAAEGQGRRSLRPSRRVIHIEYADRLDLGPGLRLVIA